MPTKNSIAEHWCETWKIDNLAMSEPSCFACHSTHGRTWNDSTLQACHLIPKRSGGPAIADNLVLLCARCHREAPMIGISAQPMIDWINNRECDVTYRLERIRDELSVLNQEKLLRFAESIPDRESLLKALRDGVYVMDYHPHPGGDSTSSFVAILRDLYL